MSRRNFDSQLRNFASTTSPLSRSDDEPQTPSDDHQQLHEHEFAELMDKVRRLVAALDKTLAAPVLG